MTTLILGSSGQLGTAFRRLLPDAVAATRQHADLTAPETLRAFIQLVKPDVVLNCAAYNAVDQAERDVAGAFAANAFALRELASACRDAGAVLVHFSTNYVFGQDSARRTPYRESDAAGPVSAYGVSKLAGEQFVRAMCPRHFVIRTCGLYGRWGSGGKGGNFVETILKRAESGQPIRVVTDEICAPTYTADLAVACAALIQTNQHGLHHITNSGQCSRFEFAQEILRRAKRQVHIEPTTQREFGAAAKRPGYAVLSMQRYEALGLPPMRSWSEALDAYLRDRSRK